MPVSHQNKFLKLLSTDRTDIHVFIKGFTGIISVCHKHFRNFINSSIFNNLLTLAVFLNTTVLAMDGLFTDEKTAKLMDAFNDTFTYLFIAELFMKLLALGPKGYVSD